MRPSAAAAARIATSSSGLAKAIESPVRQPIPTGWTVARTTGRDRAHLAGQPARSRAQVAQLVEHVTENHGVGGSIPPLGTIFPASPMEAGT